MNHDTQPYQALEVPIADWFKPLAYSLILLRCSGYPCVWYGDLYGAKGEHPFPPSCRGALPKLMLARKLYAVGQPCSFLCYICPAGSSPTLVTRALSPSTRAPRKKKKEN